MNTLQEVYEYLNTKGWVPLDDVDEQVVSLYISKTHENYLIIAPELYGETRFVFRVNRGSQLGLADQIEYEFTVLQALRRSGVTPRPFYCDCESAMKLGNGVLLMEHIPGRPMCYGDDWEAAARVLARVHTQPVDDRLIVQQSPFEDLVRECSALRGKNGSTCDECRRSKYEKYMDQLVTLGKNAKPLFADESPVIVHGMACAADFIVDSDDASIAWLVDWERGVVSSRWVDVGRFMAQAGLAGEVGFCRSDDEKARFVAAYIEAAGLDIPLEEAMTKAEIFVQATELQMLIQNCAVLS